MRTHKNNIDRLLYALQQENLVYNHNFLYFSNKKEGTTPVKFGHPDGWLYTDSGTTGDINLSNNCCRIVTSHDADALMTFQQALHEFTRWEETLKGETVSAQAQLNLSENCTLTLSLTDGINTNAHTITTDQAGDYSIDLTLKVSTNATKLYFSIESTSSNAVILISKVFANVGEIALENLPCTVKGIIGERKQYIATQTAPAEELSLCAVSIELNQNQTRLDSVLNFRFGKGSNGRSMLPDLRGYFSRSWNNGSSRDVDADTREMLGYTSVKGDYVGTEETDQLKEHQHTLEYSTTTITVGTVTSPVKGVNPALKSNTDFFGGEETRPINVSELYTIKYR